MKRLKAKTGKFGSSLCLIALSAMLMLFATQLPVFMESAAGQFFAGFWALFALTMCTAHVVRLTGERRRHITVMPPAAGPKDARTRKSVGKLRVMRG
ncbi:MULTISPECIES: hypothetical protein [Sporomusa]|uniref:hypothetical protein n=1 Tax=Sporomusa TaxID=2375 RepID=UPI001662E134|nr:MULTISPECIES: hypothetical protein [Sporomusa]MCM0759259.1 hypothetical protein [Sporomusa sphaeroides DSM 2875]HML35370.1 hypothetical protein [Sporomusa sphaeroides]